MRDFNDADRQKKKRRIELPENPGDLSPESLVQLRAMVEAAVREGYVRCAAGWRVAKDAGVSRLDVGAMIDRLGIRVTDCQLGCFTVSKTPYQAGEAPGVSEEVARRVDALTAQGGLTCADAFGIARELAVKPRAVADAANVRGCKIRQCQLGCF